MTDELQQALQQEAALVRELEQLRKRIETLRANDRQRVIEQIQTLIAEHGISWTDLGGKPRKGRNAPATGRRAKVAAKYRDPASGNQWSGRGLQPKWLVAAIAQGRTLEEFSVSPALQGKQ